MRAIILTLHWKIGAKKAFCYHKNFVPKELSAIALKPVFLYKVMKILFKIRDGSHLSEINNKWLGSQRFLLPPNFCHHNVLPMPQGYSDESDSSGLENNEIMKKQKIIMTNSFYHQSLVSEKLSANDQRLPFLCKCYHQTFVSMESSAIAPGLYTRAHTKTFPDHLCGDICISAVTNVFLGAL